MNDTVTEDPRRVATYTMGDASRYLRLPLATVRSWVVGRPYPVQEGTEFFPPVIRPEETEPVLLSFLNLVELHVLSAIRRVHGVRLDRVRQAVEYVTERLQTERPLAKRAFFTDGVDLFVKEPGLLVNASSDGQIALTQALESHLERVDSDESGLAARLFPFTRKTIENAPRLIVIDPRFSFGQPSIADLGIPTAVIADRVKSGESLQDLAEDYGCSSELVLEAIRWELPLAA